MNDDDMVKNVPTILPSGFRLRVPESNIFVFDFLDTNVKGEKAVVGSFAMGIKDAEDMERALSGALEECTQKDD